MKKELYFGALMAAMTLASCSNSDDSQQAADNSGQAQPVAVTRTPVGFDAYTGRSVTRAGTPGELNDAALQTANAGFGVFAYYTDLKKYDQTYVPNFMYNTHVHYDNGEWTYSPLMYWPNEYGSDATSDDEDKVSFFAYAPWVETGSAAAGSVSGDATWGITGFSRNTTAGDPLVKYIASFNAAQSVDLCWGVVGSTEATNGWSKIQGAGTQTITEGKPWLDIEHPQGVNQKLKFTFKHALAKLTVKIDADIDITAHSEDADPATNPAFTAAETKVWVRSISFTGIAMKGSLNLNNTTADVAQWLDYSGTTDLPYGESVTIKDGRRDGREGGSGAAATNELPQGLNSAIVQSDTGSPAGVTNTPVDLFNGSTVYVIPTGEAMTVTIVYDVETINNDLPTYISDGTTHGSSIENRISKTIKVAAADLTLTSGKAYTVNLHLGMNSVKYDAAVSGWDTGDTGEGWLPGNQN